MLFGYLEHSAEGGQRERRREEWATFILGKTLIGCHSPASRQCIHCTGNSKLGIVVHPASWKWSENFVASRLNEHAEKLFQNSIELKVKEKFKNCFKNFRNNFWPTNGPLKLYILSRSTVWIREIITLSYIHYSYLVYFRSSRWPVVPKLWTNERRSNSWKKSVARSFQEKRYSRSLGRGPIHKSLVEL